MKNKIIGIMFLASTSLFAETKTVNVDAIGSIKVSENLKVLVDCKYENKKLFGFLGGKFSTKKYSNDSFENKLMSSICEDKTENKVYEIDYWSFTSSVKKNGLYFDINIKSFDGDDYFKKGLSLNLHYYSNNPFALKSEDAIKTFPIVSLENNNLRIKHSSNSFAGLNSILDYDITIKSYKYDYENKTLTVLELDKPLPKLHQELTFTNSYDIDDQTECINGKIWIKKYGNTAGDYCQWIVKDKEVK